MKYVYFGLKIHKYIIGSLDVISLFTNVPIDLALIDIRNRWSYIKKHTSIPMDEFIMVNLCRICLVVNIFYV